MSRARLLGLALILVSAAACSGESLTGPTSPNGRLVRIQDGTVTPLPENDGGSGVIVVAAQKSGK